MRTDQTFTTGGEELVLAVSLELAAAKWKVALHDGRPGRVLDLSRAAGATRRVLRR